MNKPRDCTLLAVLRDSIMGTALAIDFELDRPENESACDTAIESAELKTPALKIIAGLSLTLLIESLLELLRLATEDARPPATAAESEAVGGGPEDALALRP
jgi:hypothetical protein